MLALNLSLGFVLLLVAVDGYYHQIRTYYQRSAMGKKKFYRVRVYELAEPDPWRQRYSRQLNYDSRRTAARSSEKGPRSDSGRSGASEYQRQDNKRTTAVRNNEKGPRGDSGRSGASEYQRRDTNARTTAVRNNEKGPRAGDSRRPGASEYQRRDTNARTTAVRNNEKGPRSDSGRSGASEYQRRDTNARTTAVRNNEKGPRAGDSGRSGASEYQRRDTNARTTAVRNNEKGPRSDSGRPGASEYDTKRTTAVRNNEKGPRRQNGHTTSATAEYQRRREQNSNQGINFQSRTTADRNNEKRSQNANSIFGIQEYQQQGQTSNNRKGSRIQSYKNSVELKSAMGYKGCKDSGLYCVHWKSIGCCELQFGRIFCSKTCGFCVPITLVCPPSNRFGCCWDGTAATDRDKSNCPPCKNISYSICSRQSIYKDCDLHERNTLTTRTLCPQICGACDDYQ